MTTDPFAAPGRFWRGNLHCHSTRSDGALPPDEVCRRYREAGYDFIALTDHFVGLYGYPITETAEFRTDAFTTIPGAELHGGAQENGQIWHVLAVGLPPDFAPPDVHDWQPRLGQETGPEIARRARDAGAFVALVHPEWSGISLDDALTLDAAHAVEVYNHGSEVCTDRGRGFWHLDRLLERGRRLSLIATDDSHFHQPDYFGGWTMVKAEENAPEALVAALKAGHHYATQGPEFHAIDWGSDAVAIECSPVSTVILSGPGNGGFSIMGDAMTTARIEYGAHLGALDWNRITLIDDRGRKAWSPAHWRRKAA